MIKKNPYGQTNAYPREDNKNFSSLSLSKHNRSLEQEDECYAHYVHVQEILNVVWQLPPVGVSDRDNLAKDGYDFVLLPRISVLSLLLALKFCDNFSSLCFPPSLSTEPP